MPDQFRDLLVEPRKFATSRNPVFGHASRAAVEKRLYWVRTPEVLKPSVPFSTAMEVSSICTASTHGLELNVSP